MKYKYIVSVSIINFDDEAKVNKSEDFTYEFKDGSLDEMRIGALKKVKDLYDFFNDEMPKGHEFHSPVEAELMNYKNVKAYSIDVFFYKDDLDYQIIGEPELEAESKEVEKTEFKKLKIRYPKRKEYIED